MIILDTNVISEPLRPAADRNVVDWLNRQTFETLFLTTISLAELRYGVAMLPEGRRKRGLSDALEACLAALFGTRIVPFDQAAAEAYGLIRAKAKVAGRAIAPIDGFIAAIAVSKGFAVATRDGESFEAAGLRVIDPWRAN